MSNDKTILELILEEMKENRKSIQEISITLAEQHSTLVEHTRRSQALESLLDETRKEIKPIQKHVQMVQGVLSFIGLIGVIVGIVTGIASLF